MKIAGIASRLPELEVSNAEIIMHVEASCLIEDQNDWSQVVSGLEQSMALSGIQTRRFLASGESWFTFLKQAISEAMDEACALPKDIDCVIYGSIFRTVLEPSMASLIAKEIGCRYASAFDVNEACASWMRGLSLASQLLGAGAYKRILLVSAEANGRWDGFGTSAFQIRSAADLAWAFPTMTIGSGFSATVLTNDTENPPWRFHHTADNNLSELSIFPLEFPKAEDHQLGATSSSGVGPGKFACFSEKLQLGAGIPYVRLLSKHVEEMTKADVILPHTQTFLPYIDLVKLLKVDPSKLHSVYSRYGNLVASSLPCNIVDGRLSGKIKRGSNVFLTIPASGLTMSTCSFVF
jgi:3-oxoacyl-[acyl-carrier-protein] synthase III